MSALDHPIKFKELQRKLREAGWFKDRMNGTHETWKEPGGHVVVITFTNGDADRSAVKDVNRAIRTWTPEGANLQDAVEAKGQSLGVEFEYLYLPQRTVVVSQDRVLDVLLANPDLWSKNQEEARELALVEHSEISLCLYRACLWTPSQETRIEFLQEVEGSKPSWVEIYSGYSLSFYRGMSRTIQVKQTRAVVQPRDEEVTLGKFHWRIGFARSEGGLFYPVDEREGTHRDILRLLNEWSTQRERCLPPSLLSLEGLYTPLYAWPLKPDGVWTYVADHDDSQIWKGDRKAVQLEKDMIPCEVFPGFNPVEPSPSEPETDSSIPPVEFGVENTDEEAGYPGPQRHGPVTFYKDRPDSKGRHVWVARLILVNAKGKKVIRTHRVPGKKKEELEPIARAMCEEFSVPFDSARSLENPPYESPVLPKREDPSEAVEKKPSKPVLYNLVFDKVLALCDKQGAEGLFHYRVRNRDNKDRKWVFSGWFIPEGVIQAVEEKGFTFLGYRRCDERGRKLLPNLPGYEPKSLSFEGREVPEALAPSTSLQAPQTSLSPSSVQESIHVSIPSSEILSHEKSEPEEGPMDDPVQKLLSRASALAIRLSTPEVRFLIGEVTAEEVLHRALLGIGAQLSEPYVSSALPWLDHATLLANRLSTPEVKLLQGDVTAEEVVELALGRLETSLGMSS
jgi:predicted RNA binding protein YcfA (HicA-like mRNA interferase family)